MRHSLRLDADPSAPWSDKATRPFDTPLVPVFGLDKARAAASGLPPVQRIVSSPMRRCLQTAGEVARTLGISEVQVDMALVETMAWAVRSMQDVPKYLSMLNVQEMQEALGEGVALGTTTGTLVAVADDRAATKRFQSVIQASASGTLLVSHGDAVDAAAALVGMLVYDVPECSWISLCADGRYSVGGGVQCMP